MPYILFLGFLALTQAFSLNLPLVLPTDQVCLACCGPSPCCNDCGLSHSIISLLKPQVGTKVNGKEVVSSKRFLDSFGSLDKCLDCCGEHPCCSDCGLGDLFGHHGLPPLGGHGHTLFPPMSTEAPKSPEKEETYGTDFNSQVGHIINSGFPNVDPLGGLVDPDLSVTEKPYYEILGKKK